MEQAVIQQLLQSFEAISKTTDDGIEFRLARDLQKVLWYKEWRNFMNVIEKAKDGVETTSTAIEDHFVDVNKMVKIWSDTDRPIPDIMLTRYACYLIAQNGNTTKPEIAFAQSYFAVQTRKAEIIEQKLADIERVTARKKLTMTEKELSKVIFEQTKSDWNFALIRSKWDAALFGWMKTSDMKRKRQITPNRPLADYMPTLLLKAKDFATEITIYNAKQNKMSREDEISKEHIENNASVRDTLIQRWIVPEEMHPEEDIKKIERKLKSDQKHISKDTPWLTWWR